MLIDKVNLFTSLTVAVTSTMFHSWTVKPSQIPKSIEKTLIVMTSWHHDVECNQRAMAQETMEQRQ